MKLSEYDFEISYRKGKANANADAMSRIEVENPSNAGVDRKEDLIEALLSIYDDEDKICYSDKNILDAPKEEAIAVCVSADLKVVRGIWKQIQSKFEGFKSLKRHKLKVGTCVVWQNKCTVFYLITKKRSTDIPTYDTLKDCLHDLHKKCKELNITKISFPKHGAGLDKLNWNEIRLSIIELNH